MTTLFQSYGQWLSSGLAGCMTGGIVWWLTRVIGTPRRQPGDSWESERRHALRAESRIYRWFEPLVDELARNLFAGADHSTLEHHMRLAGESLPMRPSELLATKLIEGAIAGLAIFGCVSPTGFVFFAALLGTIVACVYPVLARNSIVNRSKQRLKQIRVRLPFVVDQISLMMQAGAGFEESLHTVADDNRDHALHEELREVLRQIGLGRPREQALVGFRDRLADDDVSELIFAIIKGEELGTPLSSILREQANQMRLKRSQWGEKAAAEAEVQIVFPGMITMLACLLVIVTPIILPALMTFLNDS